MPRHAKKRVGKAAAVAAADATAVAASDAVTDAAADAATDAAAATVVTDHDFGDGFVCQVDGQAEDMLAILRAGLYFLVFDTTEVARYPSVAPLEATDDGYIFTFHRGDYLKVLVFHVRHTEPGRCTDALAHVMMKSRFNTRYKNWEVLDEEMLFRTSDDSHDLRLCISYGGSSAIFVNHTTRQQGIFSEEVWLLPPASAPTSDSASTLVVNCPECAKYQPRRYSSRRLKRATAIAQRQSDGGVFVWRGRRVTLDISVDDIATLARNNNALHPSCVRRIHVPRLYPMDRPSDDGDAYVTAYHPTYKLTECRIHHALDMEGAAYGTHKELAETLLHDAVQVSRWSRENHDKYIVLCAL